MPDIDEIARSARACRICIDRPIKTPLPHAPRPVLQVSRSARLCICGQAPGTRVHASGLPFTDPSGDRLRTWLGVDTDTFYDPNRLAIVPMGFCFPGQDDRGGDLPPRRECRMAWHDSIFAAMPRIELIVAIGQYALAYHLGTTRASSLTETVRHWRRYRNRSPAILPLPHPSWRNNAWLKQNSWFEQEVIPALREDVERLTTKSD